MTLQFGALADEFLLYQKAGRPERRILAYGSIPGTQDSKTEPPYSYTVLGSMQRTSFRQDHFEARFRLTPRQNQTDETTIKLEGPLEQPKRIQVTVQHGKTSGFQLALPNATWLLGAKNQVLVQDSLALWKRVANKPKGAFQTFPR